MQLSNEDSKHGVIARSAGNHAQGVAYAGSMKNIPCTIIMPENASPAKVGAMKAYGANVIRSGSNDHEAWKEQRKLQKEQSRTIIHAFDDEKIISGQGTIGLEILEDLLDLDEIYIPIGGGGLAAGIAIAIKTKKPHVKIYRCRIKGVFWYERLSP